MSNVRGNPAEMRKFAQALRRFSQTLDNEVKRIDAQSRSVGSSWNDPQYKKFMAEWERTLSAVKRFTREAPKYERYVNRKAKDLEQYLKSGGI